MSTTNMIVAKVDNGTPSCSRVIVPGQSHISSGMNVLPEFVCCQNLRTRSGVLHNVLDFIFGEPGCRLGKECLLRIKAFK